MTYYIGEEANLSEVLGTGNRRYFYALRRTDDGLLYFFRLDQLKDTNDEIIINDPGLAENDFEEFEYGVDFFDGRLAEDHSRPYTNLRWDQYRWDTNSVYCYINDNGEFVVRLNRSYEYPATFVASITGTTMTVTAMDSGIIKTGMTLTGTGVETGTSIVTQLTGSTGTVGTYTVSVNYDGTPAPISAVHIGGTL
jgi:hypothetical protein